MRRIPFKHILGRFAGLWALACLFTLSAQAAPTITVSASAVSILGTSQTISITCTLIDPNQTGNLRVSGTGVIPVMQASTVTPGATATVGPIYGNDVILDGFGNLNNTYYKVQVFTVTNGIIASTPSLQNFYAFIGSGTVDLSTATPLAPSFMSGASGSVVIPGAFSVTGTSTLSGATGIGLLNNVLTVGPAAFRYTTIAGAIASADCPTTFGCTIFVRSDATLDASTISITKPVHIIFDYGNYASAATGSMFSCTTGIEGVRISGQNRNATGNSSGTLINLSGVASVGFNFTNCPGAQVDNFTLSGAGSGTGASNKGMVLAGHDIAAINVLVTSFGGVGITFDGTSVNTNDCKMWNSRSQNNGGTGVVFTGANANDCAIVNSSAGGNLGVGFFVTGTAQFEGFYNTDTAGNVGIGYELNGPNNILFAFSDAPNAPETAAIQFDAAGSNNEVHCLKNAMPINTDNGSGNRYYGCGGTFGAGASIWNRLNSQVFVAQDGSVGGPAFVFNSEASGFYRAGASDERFSQAGADYWRWLSSGAILTAAMPLDWGSSGVASPDVGLSRVSAGVLGLGNSGAANATATLKLNKLQDNAGNTASNVPFAVTLTSAYTNATTGFTTVTGGNTLQFSVLANVNYTAECHLYYQAAATGGLNVQFTGPAAPTAVAIGLNAPLTATTFNNSVVTAFSTTQGTAVGTAATNFDAIVTLGLVNGANAGTVILQAKSSAAVNLTIQPGSFCRVQ